MQIKRYVAEDMRQVLKQVKEEQGPDAVILSSRQVPEGLEVVAAVDYDASLISPSLEGFSDRDAPAERRLYSYDREDAVAPRRVEPPSPRPSAPRPSAQSGYASAAPRPAPRSVKPPSQTDAGALSGMRKEINALRRMLECQLSSLAWNDFSRRSPVRANLLRNLIHLGLPSTLAQDVASRVPSDERDPRSAWQQALSDFCGLVPVNSGDPLAEGGVFALVGPTGVGKTTAVVRLAVRAAELHGAENVAMISTDNSRPGSQECLFSYGRKWSIPVYVADDIAAVERHLERLAHVPVILIDTAGDRDDQGPFRLPSENYLPGGRSLTRWLVLAANAQFQALEDVSALYAKAPLSGIIATKVDEAASLGGLLSVIVRSGVMLTLVSDSAKLSRPLQSPDSRALVRRAVELMRASPAQRMDKESLAQQIGELHYALG